MKEELVYFKQELLNLPKGKEQEYKTKYSTYNTQVADLEYQAKRLDLIIRNDEVGLL